MVTLNHLSVEDPDGGAPLLPVAAETMTPTPVPHHQKAALKTGRDFFLSRKENYTLSLLLLIGCYSVILFPAYFPLNNLSSDDNDYQDPKDLLLFNRSALLLSQPCQPRLGLDHLEMLACSKGLVNLPVFVQEHRPGTWNEAPPGGFQGAEEHLALALASMPQPGLPLSLSKEGRCRRCVVVGSGGVLHGSHLGSHIDQYDVIIRLNNAPVHGFERDAGSLTTIRLMYPEAAPHSADEYKNTAMIALVVFKNLDLDWLTSVITKQPLSFWSKMWFWREVVDDIPLKPESFRILHPDIIHKTEQVLQKYAQKQGNTSGGRRWPTSGASAVVMALQLCDQVSLAGFGYNMQHLKARLHYYGAVRMETMKAQVVHDVSAEKLFLGDLVAAGVVTDLTGAL
ncbi:PREDICTED: lactosylceramide alpha-2,3-sialyltransferase-like [Cyprinodon variegatus]|uniref:Lactosylceramide alpha-2,3-sialyltransferase n=1 Tax=Cyprinodon variegatus TaxID=28743 RepID=A0A3Q2C9Z2_CYPVA|nr:PREDICTED: lactosylceramide alpha-2,3-sialyltransferase-like [Cyprinodon variegatus]XP_015233126.1 PREDICTED: lactosylceramide alpha-2,3-sialyltransferase-like [Cyprinodon variegatus]XP_015233128.1 PREDICTED: lactosylceramide alpha-2,3-sialyltransferase-like [Cyprinodon variegatus]